MKQIPKTERIWVTIRDRKKSGCHIITTKEDSRSTSYLYECGPDGVSRLGHAESPTELERQWPL